jgi:hypothetical protein
MDVAATIVKIHKVSPIIEVFNGLTIQIIDFGDMHEQYKRENK